MKSKALLAYKIIGVVVIAAATLNLLFAVLPYKELDSFLCREYSTRVYDRKENLLQVIPLKNGLRREYVSIKKIPKKLKKTFIKAEDKRFYFHHGVDYISVVRAFFQNTINKKNVSGASTITMQLAKIINASYRNENNFIISSSERTLSQKLKEVFCAYKLEARFSKKEILELYLNSIPFGNNVEGVESASRVFFGKEITKLDPKQIEVLSKIPRRPTFYGKNKKEFQFPYFAPHLIRYLCDNNFFMNEHDFTSKVYKSKTPYEVHLSLDFDVQNYVQTQADKAMNEASGSRISNISVLVVDVETGNVLSWVGSNDFYDDEAGQIDGVRFRNQPGSSIKPFLYALCLDEGIVKPTSVIADTPIEFINEEGKSYIPFNFNNRFNGPVRLRVALASSLNIPAVKLLDLVTIDKFADKLDELGFGAIKRRAHETGLSLALGGGEVSLQEFVPAFATLARDGKYLSLKYLSGSDSKKEKKQISKQIYSSDTVRIIDSFLSDKSARSLGFGFYQTFETKYPSIFKTGTSNQFQNITALGATPRYAVGVWMGNFSGETVIGKTGSSLPAYVAKKVLDYLELNDAKESVPFEEPQNYHKEKICPLSGMLPSSICRNSISEYVKDGDKLSECSWHVLVDQNLSVNYPAEYQQWFELNSDLYSHSATVNYKTSPLKIISPREGSLFYFDQYSRYNQIVTIEVIGGEEETVDIFIDDQFLCTKKRPCVVDVPLEKGRHYIKAICSNQENSVSYEVK